jgi:hypothetical protein
MNSGAKNFETITPKKHTPSVVEFNAEDRLDSVPQSNVRVPAAPGFAEFHLSE